MLRECPQMRLESPLDYICDAGRAGEGNVSLPVVSHNLSLVASGWALCEVKHTLKTTLRPPLRMLSPSWSGIMSVSISNVAIVDLLAWTLPALVSRLFWL